MRQHQKEYFRTRDKTTLIVSKQLEKKVDELIQSIEDQQELFGPISPTVQNLINKVNNYEPHGGEGL